jgi:hypothetical protein
MSANDRVKLARDVYGAYESGDRRVVEERLSDDFTFYSPADVESTAPNTSSAAGRTTSGSSPSSSSGSSRPATRS